MSHNVESMFSVREVPWHGLGRIVSEAPNSREAIKLAGLDWNILQQPIYTPNPADNQNQSIQRISNYWANVRSTDSTVLGIVGKKYKVVQNYEAFNFTDILLDYGAKYETAGSLKEGKIIWLLAKLPDAMVVCKDQIDNYLLFSNSHDGCGPINIAVTPIRVVCNNTLNLALKRAKRTWTIPHIGNINEKVMRAKEVLDYGNDYTRHLQQELIRLNQIRLTQDKVKEILANIFPINKEKDGKQKQENQNNKRQKIEQFFYDSEDLKHLNFSAYRLINAISDFADHCFSDKKDRENQMLEVVNGHELLDSVYKNILEIA